MVEYESFILLAVFIEEISRNFKAVARNRQAVIVLLRRTRSNGYGAGRYGERAVGEVDIVVGSFIRAAVGNFYAVYVICTACVGNG